MLMTITPFFRTGKGSLATRKQEARISQNARINTRVVHHTPFIADIGSRVFGFGESWRRLAQGRKLGQAVEPILLDAQ